MNRLYDNEIFINNSQFTQLPTFNRRSFSVAAPSVWNSLPADIRLCESVPLFKRHLKTHLFRLT